MGLLFARFSSDALLILGIALLALIYHYIRSFSYWKRRGVQYLQPSFPFGNVTDIVFSRKNFGLTIKDVYERMKEKKIARYGGFWMVTRPMLLITDTEIIKQILIKEFPSFHSRGIYSNKETDPLGENLFTMCSERWKLIRNKITPTFTSGKMKMMFPIFDKCGQQLSDAVLKYAESGEPLPAKDTLSRFTIDIIGNCVLGLDCNSLKDSDTEFLKIGKLFLSTTLSNNLILVMGFMFPMILRTFKIRTTRNEVEDFFFGILKNTIKYREENSIRCKDFMDMFIRLKNNLSVEDDAVTNDEVTKVDDKNELTFEELASVAFVFFVAGFETSSSTISNTLYELSLNQEVQEKARKEILDALKSNNGELTYEILMGMKYLEQCINETLRKYPVAPNIIRRCHKEYKLPGTDLTIEEGMQVFISVMGFHYDPDIFPEPEKYNPDRFSDENKSKIKQYHYLPFGEGPRMCIGNRFAMIQTKMGLISLLSKYKFTMNPKTKVPMEWTPNGILLFTKNEIWLQMSKINEK